MKSARELVLVAELLNTLDQRTFLRHGSAHRTEDRLTSGDALAAWFDERGLPRAAGQADLEAARSLRAGLRGTLLGEQTVDDALGRFPLRLVPADDGLRLAAETGSEGLDVLVGTVAHAIADGSWKRLRLCASDDCRWAFVDTSRSGGGRWCSMEVCGNRHKTRAYRQRTSGRTDSEPPR